MDHTRSHRRFVKCVGGAVSELWSDTEQYVVDREYLVTLDVVGDAFVGYIDGVESSSIRDGEIAAGGIGLHCWANAGARFASTRGTPAGWGTYYPFGGDEPRLAARV